MKTGKKLRVCFDARKCGDGGIGVYIRNAIYGLLHQDVHLTLLTNDQENLVKSLGKTLRQLVKENEEDVAIQTVEAKPFTLKELFFFHREVDWKLYDVFHTPNYLLPFRIGCPTVVTVHDLIHLYYPEKALYPLAAVPLLYSALFRAKKIICVSESTRDDLGKLCRFSRRLSNKLTVIPNALCASFQSKSARPELLRTRFQLKSPYFLSVLSTVKPHKGLNDLLEAFRKLEGKKRKGKRGPELVLVGQGTVNIVKIERLLESASALKRVRLLGSVTQEELYQLYSQATALIVPSFREGFCLPVIEAHAVETPVITRPIPAVLENTSPRDVICEDFTVKGLVSGIERFLDLRDEMDQEASSEFPMLSAWQKSFRERVDPLRCGQKIFEVYCEAADFSVSAEEELGAEKQVAKAV